MRSCMILYHPTITSITKCMMLRSMFDYNMLEIEVIENHTVIAYIEGVSKLTVWQNALHFEVSNICTGYGFGTTKKDAKTAALDVLLKRKQKEGITSLLELHIKEKQ